MLRVINKGELITGHTVSLMNDEDSGRKWVHVNDKQTNKNSTLFPLSEMLDVVMNSCETAELMKKSQDLERKLIMDRYTNEHKVKRFIVCACNKYSHGDDVVLITGPRHYDKVMHSQLKALDEHLKELLGKRPEQGFIDQFGVFWSRIDSLDIILQNGQDINWERNESCMELFSEGLY